jgi:Mg-chelatase subunit ChlD
VTFASPAALWLGLLAAPIIALHMLRPRRPPVEVSSTFLWREVSRPVSSAVPWQRLRPTALLLLQLLAVGLLAIAAARPARATGTPLARHTVFIVDTSGSMAALDGQPDRLGTAKSKAESLRRQLPAGGVASIVVAGAEPRALLSASPDAAAFAGALARIQVEGGTPDYATAFSLAESLETPGVPAGFVFLSDGELTGDEAKLLPPGTRYVKVGARTTNRAITALRVDPAGSGLHATITVRNTGGPAATQSVRLDVDGRTAARQNITLEPGATVTRQIDLPGGDRVDAYLEGEDLLAADNHAVAVAARRRALRVLLAGPDDIFVQQLLAASAGVTVVRSPTATPAPGFDLAIYDGVAVPADPAAPFLAIDPPGGMAGVTVTGTVTQPAVTLVKANDALLANLDLSNVAIAEAQKLSAPTDEVLVGAEGTPLLIRGSRANQPFAYFSFALGRSNLGVQVAWPILGDRLLTSLTGATVPLANLIVGQPLPLGSAHPALVVTGPAGINLMVAPDGPPPVADHTGFWTVSASGTRGAQQVLAVNADPRQSDLTPAGSLPIRPRPTLPGEHRTTGQQPLLGWVAAALLLVIAVELWLAWRSRAVPPRQWRASLALRVVIVAALVAALLGVALARTERRVAVVFLLDQSDSLGAGGRQLAADWVRGALRHQAKNDLAGVVLFGADAKVDLTVQRNTRLLEPATRVDTTATNLAGALRLGGALLPSSARRRIVVVSDGRQTQGDAIAETARLRASGIQVDVHPVATNAGADVAVIGLRPPSVVRPGEAFSLQATIAADHATTVAIALSRDGAVVAERTIPVPAGQSVVDLPQVVDPAAGTGVLRYRLDINAPNDQLPENNVGFAAVPVAGPARVLVVEGMTGEGATLAAALKAGGLQVDIVGVAALPTVDQLAGYTSTVLVDVDSRSLAPAQTAALAVASKDFGDGLVAIGGDRSYGLGGYLNSDLEQLLPVISDVTDPKRRLSVAEVLAVDSSGSMTACHCNGGANGLATGANRAGGGVNKTDVSRAAAARAINALNANDQVGVLAFNTEQRWIVPLQALPAADVVTKGLNSLTPAGGTDLTTPLPKAAAALKAAKAQLKHIILFTDGFTSQAALVGLAQQAAQLYAEGITVSVLATGEASTDQLAAVAAAGHGRFYAGQDLSQVPTIMAAEAVLATRNLVAEGSFYPKVVSSAAPVRNLTASPPLLGYLATTAKPSATTLLTVGDQGDPLLASWRDGLGTVTSWTSDASARWSQQWATWPGYVSFWTGVVKDTFPLRGAAGSSVRAETVGSSVRVTVERQDAWPDGATAVAHVADPNLNDLTVPLQQTSATTFVGEVPAAAAGTYAVGATVNGPGGPLLSGTAVAIQSYSAEYLPGQPDAASLVRISRLTGGRGAIDATRAFDAGTLPAGRGRIPLAGWLLLAAALLWPVTVALGRLAFHGAAQPRWKQALTAGRRLARRERSPTPRKDKPGKKGPDPPTPPPTIDRLLERKRDRRR